MMSLILSVIIAVLLTVPGMYLIARTKLASSFIELVSNGFFFGFGLVVVVYLSFCRLLPSYCVDMVVVSASVVALVLLVRELRAQKLPLWLKPFDRTQAILVSVSMIFMIVFAFGELTRRLDDDIFIHLPVIKRVSMGDIPPHMPYFPQGYMRGHVARDVFVGTVARLLALRPEVSIIYVTLMVCPFYVLVFHSLAWRLARGRPISSRFCFIGLLFLVSCAVSDIELRAGSLTFVFNHLIFAYSHAVFIGWLVERVSSTIAKQGTLREALLGNKLTLIISMLAFASMYFVYMSNFLMFALLIGSLPLLTLIIGERNLKSFIRALCVVGVVAAGGFLLLGVSSSFVLERVLLSLNLTKSCEPTGFMQQTQLSFPKLPLFNITDPGGNDIPFFSVKFLAAQGLSFYVGLSGLIVGPLMKDIRLFATSWLGWLTIAWVLLVDMGDYRADTLRLMLLAHMAFGACTGLIIGMIIEHVFSTGASQQAGSARNSRLARGLVVLLCSALCLWMGWGNIRKLIENKNYRIGHSFQRLRAIDIKDPEKWLESMAIPPIDFEVFQTLASYIRSPKATVLLKDNQQPGYAPQFINLCSLTGAGVAGVCQNHICDTSMGRIIMGYDYRASLFWQHPSKELLRQLAPDWIVVDSGSVEPDLLKRVVELPGVTLARTFEDNVGRKRILFSYKKEPYSAPTTLAKSVTPQSYSVATAPLGVVVLPVVVDIEDASKPVDIAMVVTDKSDRVANVMDFPIVGMENTGARNFKMYFSMIQSGHWKVYFVDPASNRRLNERPVEVDVAK